jgi:hypothetical protein
VIVADLVSLMQTFSQDAPAGVLTVCRAGIVIDVETAPVLTIEQTIADDGTVEAVWITGIGEAAVPPPTLITWQCAWDLLTVDQHGTWPADHDPHLDDRPRP